MRPIKRIIIHCSATSPDADIGADEIRQWHKDKGWSDIGYHGVIRRNGALENGRPIEKKGAHAKGYNDDSLGYCLAGGIDKDGNPDCNYTRAQWMTLDRLVETLEYEFPDAEFEGHRDLPGVTKACPCFDVKSWYGGR
jgi:N-acetyl-anhydromuramyl-L-alanine amidase AmpD